VLLVNTADRVYSDSPKLDHCLLESLALQLSCTASVDSQLADSDTAVGLRAGLDTSAAAAVPPDD
jgi:hypothetical protein